MFLFIFCKAKCECSSASDLHQKACTKRQDLDYSKHSSSFKCQHHMTLEHSKDSSTTSSHHRNHLWLGLWFLHQQRKKSVNENLHPGTKITVQLFKLTFEISKWVPRITDTFILGSFKKRLQEQLITVVVNTWPQWNVAYFRRFQLRGYKDIKIIILPNNCCSRISKGYQTHLNISIPVKG